MCLETRHRRKAPKRVVVLDWDETLYWSSGLNDDGTLKRPRTKKEWRRYEAALCALLEFLFDEADAQVYLVTYARRSWVNRCLRTLSARTQALVQRCVLFARPELKEIEPAAWKAHCIARIARAHPEASQWGCVGDAWYEHAAFLYVFRSALRCAHVAEFRSQSCQHVRHVKTPSQVPCIAARAPCAFYTAKLREDPTLAQITQQLSVVRKDLGQFFSATRKTKLGPSSIAHLRRRFHPV